MTASSRELDPDALVRLRAGLRLMGLYRLADPEAAEEAAQESLARVLAAVRQGRLEDPTRLGAFARSVAHHVIVEMQRARARQEPLATVLKVKRVRVPLAVVFEHGVEDREQLSHAGGGSHLEGLARGAEPLVEDP